MTDFENVLWFYSMLSRTFSELSAKGTRLGLFCRKLAVIVFALSLSVTYSFAPLSVLAESTVSIRDGYFWDANANSGAGDYWLPRGIAYQTWNKPLGQWQSKKELIADLDRIQKLGADALRVDLVWGALEVREGVYQWDNYDLLLEECKKRGIRVFALIGYQWPPSWFSPDLYTKHPPDIDHPKAFWSSDIISFENPVAREKFAHFLVAVTERYSSSGVRKDLCSTIAAWILGNEYGYLGLWSVKHDGYDDASKRAFRSWLRKKYRSKIEALNEHWASDIRAWPGYLPGLPYKSFDDVDMPTPYGSSGVLDKGLDTKFIVSWNVLNQWRKQSVAEFVALAAKSVRKVDAEHLITYSAVGMHWGEIDSMYQAEDPHSIAEACKAAGAPLNFWSVNIYPHAPSESFELNTVKWGMNYASVSTGLPVFATETGSSSTETMYESNELLQAKMVRNAFWDVLMSGGMGVCLFHWHDRSAMVSARERGYGLLRLNRSPKPAYFAVQEAFRIFETTRFAKLLIGSHEQTPDVGIYHDEAVDTISKRYFLEVKGLFAALERAGFEPTFVKEGMLRSDALEKLKVILLPRNEKMEAPALSGLFDVVRRGVNIHANCDLPGMRDEYGSVRESAEYEHFAQSLFGFKLSKATLHSSELGYVETNSLMPSLPVSVYDSLTHIRQPLSVWKFNTIQATEPKAVHYFLNDFPAVIFKSHDAGQGKSILNTFCLGHSDLSFAERVAWIKKLYMSSEGFGLHPHLNIDSGNVLVDFRTTAQGAILMSVHNFSKSTQKVEIGAEFLGKKKVSGLSLVQQKTSTIDQSARLKLRLDGHDFQLYSIE